MAVRICILERAHCSVIRSLYFSSCTLSRGGRHARMTLCGNPKFSDGTQLTWVREGRKEGSVLYSTGSRRGFTGYQNRHLDFIRIFIRVVREISLGLLSAQSSHLRLSLRLNTAYPDLELADRNSTHTPYKTQRTKRLATNVAALITRSLKSLAPVSRSDAHSTCSALSSSSNPSFIFLQDCSF